MNLNSDNEYNSDENNENEEIIPEYACSYCQLSDVNCVVQCNNCKKWFCNVNDGKCGSHIIQHFIRSRHKEVKLHPESEFGDTILECYNCGNRNIFVLGFIPDEQNACYVLICRDNCLNQNGIKDMGWDPHEWEPIISEKCIVDKMVKNRDEGDTRVRNLTLSQISQLEEAWKTNPDAKFEDLSNMTVKDEIIPVLKTYQDGYEYETVFLPLIKRVEQADKEMCQNLYKDYIDVTWDIGLNQKKQAIFRLTHGDAHSLISIGDELTLSVSLNNSEKWSGDGLVIKIEEDLIFLEMKNKNVPTSITSGYKVDYVWSDVPYARMTKAVTKFSRQKDSVSDYLFNSLLGNETEPNLINVNLPSELSIPGLPGLNYSQIEAIKSVLIHPLSLIQGPPGTGKTVTSATIVYHLVKQFGNQVLVCAPSNIAVDQLTEKIHATGLRVIRVIAKSKEVVSGSIEHLCLHYLEKFVGGKDSELYKLQSLKESVGELSAKDESRYEKLSREAENLILSKAEVICCTCSVAASPKFRSYKFRHVLIDEATQAMEPECLIPIVLGCKQLILVGDHQQLGPVVLDRKAAAAGLSQSLFERLISLNYHPIRLTIQYRMHPALALFPSTTFYEGTLQNGVTELQRKRPEVHFPWVNPSAPMLFYVCNGREELSSSGTSYLNRMEAQQCEKIVTLLLNSFVSPQQIGIITPYEGQRSYIVNYMQLNGSLPRILYQDVEVANVDGFQGREKDYIILTCVRSNYRSELGFITDPRRLNVALTRAKYGLVILGNPTSLARNVLWNNLLVHFQENKCLVDGPLDNLRECIMRFPKPKKYYNKHTLQMAQNVSNDTFDDIGNDFGQLTAESDYNNVIIDGYDDNTPNIPKDAWDNENNLPPENDLMDLQLSDDED